MKCHKWLDKATSLMLVAGFSACGSTQEAGTGSTSAAAEDTQIPQTLQQWYACAAAVVAYNDQEALTLAEMNTSTEWQTTTFAEGDVATDATACATFASRIDRLVRTNVGGFPAIVAVGYPREGEEVVPGEPAAFTIYAGWKPEHRNNEDASSMFLINGQNVPVITANADADRAIALGMNLARVTTGTETQVDYYSVNGSEDDGPYSEASRGNLILTANLPASGAWDAQVDASMLDLREQIVMAGGLESFADTASTEGGLIAMPGVSALSMFVATVLPDFVWLVDSETNTRATNGSVFDEGTRWRFNLRDYEQLGTVAFWSADPDEACRLN